MYFYITLIYFKNAGEENGKDCAVDNQLWKGLLVHVGYIFAWLNLGKKHSFNFKVDCAVVPRNIARVGFISRKFESKIQITHNLHKINK